MDADVELFDCEHKTPAPATHGIPYIAIPEMKEGRLDVSNARLVAEQNVTLWNRRVTPKEGDVILSRRTNPGVTAVVPANFPCVLGQNLVILRSRGTKVDQGFLRWLTRSPAWWQQIEKNLNVGAVFDSLRCADIPGFELAFPPLGEQRTIASFLGALDDKIELNRQMNETLEAMTQALFKSWFVDFDPVRAKAEGRDPGLPQPLTDLFPARLVDSELGEIPEGWEVGRLGDVLCQRVERCIASAETVARPYVPIECISSKSLFLADSKPGEEAQSSLTKFYKDDLLFGAMRPYFHKVCIAPFDGTTRTTVFVLYPRRKDDFAFATLLLHDSETIDFATRHSTGSTIPYAVWVDSMDGMPTVLPPSDVRAAFDHAVRPVLARIPRPYFESRTLADLRDTLLPKLISGELRISNEERATIREA
jgi:type I restriction enzyme S subunit